MCGIAGLLTAGPVDRNALGLMAEALAHRGPDGRGCFVDESAGIGLIHNRLSIIDLSEAGRQPMWSEDGNLGLIFNGEIYNFRELHGELEAKGHRFSSRTDCETVLHGFEEWGDGMLPKLSGMFAFAIWNKKERSLFLARDPMGIKPLYYTWLPDGEFVFASELKAFLAHPDFSARPNFFAIRQFMEANFILDEHATGLECVRKLPPGETLTMRYEDIQSRFHPVPRRYFRPPEVQSRPSNDVELDRRADELGDLLDEVVGQHLVADVPVAMLLSGGLDSSVIAALAAKRGPVKTITMAFANSAVDERPHARRVADFLGTEHEEILLNPEEIAGDLERAVGMVDELHGDWGAVSTAVLYRRCRERGVKVVLVGEGSDEIFGGYPDFETAGEPGVSRSRRALRLYRWFSGRRWGREFPTFYSALADYDRETDDDAFDSVRLFETRRQLPSCYNMKVDRASMSASVEARVPFLDVRVAEFAYRTGREALLRDGSNKQLLRRMAKRRNLLPVETIARPKFGGSIATSWMEQVPGFRSFARDVVLDRTGWAAPLKLEKPMLEYFDLGKIGYSFPRGISIFSIVAWRLLMLNLWSRANGVRAQA